MFSTSSVPVQHHCNTMFSSALSVVVLLTVLCALGGTEAKWKIDKVAKCNNLRYHYNNIVRRLEKHQCGYGKCAPSPPHTLTHALARTLSPHTHTHTHTHTHLSLIHI